MATRPIVGITTYAKDEAGRFSLPVEYVEAVQRAGGIALLIPPAERNVSALMTRFDAIVLTGGGDIDPSLYSRSRHPSVYQIDRQRDDLELALATAVIRGGVPTLGICRGCQVINVAQGGSLHQHLPDVIGEAVMHHLPPHEPTSHLIEVAAGSRLARVVGQLRFSAASWHHQGISEIGQGLAVVATAPDGVIEAVEMASHPWLVAVQWHPELTAAEDLPQQKLFEALVRAANAGMEA